MIVTTKPVNLVKSDCIGTGPSLIEQADNLAERAFSLALELDAAKVELAELENVEIGWIKIALGLMVERDAYAVALYQATRELEALAAS
ncbi:hypothetical protein [Streptomyces sp. x-19]|uniref:hypothetical protein n=1 Tax=Streptomyces sp. x-19 TaxID=2789280 RepID=UPI00397F18DB